MTILPEEIQTYLTNHASAELEVLKELSAYTHAHIPMPNMLSGHEQGVFLQILSKIIRPKRILEIGTYTGYSAICLAQGLMNGGKLTTIDINEELKSLALEYFDKAGLSDKIELITGDAKEIIETLEGEFDIVFIDADKSNYYNYYQKVIDKVRPGGLIIADNVLWKGKVIDNSVKDKRTESIRNFNLCIQNDERVENVIIPLRDGLMLIYKK
jgi:predicted O-methyltransferase YrrM